MPAAALLAAALPRAADGGAVAWHKFAPSATDPGMRPPSYADGQHWAAPPALRATGLLSVFLPGTSASPSCCGDFLASSVGVGHHTIGLSYQYCKQTVAGSANWCHKNHPGDCTCQEGVHREVILGGGGSYSGAVSVTPPNGVVSRLASALRFLDARYPSEGWGEFLNGTGGPEWRKVVVSGHSQGAGHAAYLAKRVAEVHRAVPLSGPEDQDASCAGSWQGSADWATPPTPARFRPFAHQHEDELAAIEDSWRAMGWADDGWVDVGDAAAPAAAWASASALLTGVKPGSSIPIRPYHCSTAVDSFTPKAEGGGALYAEAVWPFLLAGGDAPAPPAPPAPPAQVYACKANRCAAAARGLPKAACEAACG